MLRNVSNRSFPSPPLPPRYSHYVPLLLIAPAPPPAGGSWWARCPTAVRGLAWPSASPTSARSETWAWAPATWSTACDSRPGRTPYPMEPDGHSPRSHQDPHTPTDSDSMAAPQSLLFGFILGFPHRKKHFAHTLITFLSLSQTAKT